MDYASDTARGRVGLLSTYTAPCLGEMVHLDDFASVTEDLTQYSRFEIGDLPNTDFGMSMSQYEKK